MIKIPKITFLLLLFFLYLSSRDMSGFSLLFAATSISLYLLVTAKIWIKKTTSKLAIFIFLVSFIFIYSFNIQLDLISIFKKFKDVYWLLLAMALLRHISKEISISDFVAQFFTQKQPYKATLLLSTYATLLSWPLSLGVVPMLIDTLKSRVNNPQRLAAIAMRIVCATMLLMPTTIGSAAVFSTVAEIQLSQVIVIGFPLFLVSFILCQKDSVYFYPFADKTEENLSREPIYYFSFFWFLFVFGYFYLELNSIQSLSFSGFVIYTVFLWIDRKNMRSHLNFINHSFSTVSPEVFLLLSCALLSQVIPSVINRVPMQLFDYMNIVSSLYIYMLIIIVLPLFCVIGIHPMVLFSFSYPIFSPYIGEGAHAYIVWVMMFFSAQLLSPVSINAIFAANSLQTSSIKTSFVMHIKYLLILSPVAIIYLNYLR